MGRPKKAVPLADLEAQAADLMKKLRAARKAAVGKDKADAERRALLLGKAALEHLSPVELEALIVGVIDGHIKAADDLALFDRWLKPAPSPGKAGATKPG